MRSKPNRLAIFAIVIIIILALGALAIWLITRPTLELYANCGDYTVYTINHGAWSSFRYQVRQNNNILADELTRSEFDDYTSTHNLTCLVVTGG